MAVPAVGPILNKPLPTHLPILPNSIVAPYVQLFVDEVSCMHEKRGAREGSLQLQWDYTPRERRVGIKKKKQEDEETSKWQSAQACT